MIEVVSWVQESESLNKRRPTPKRGPCDFINPSLLVRSAPFVGPGSFFVISWRWPVTFIGVCNDDHLLFRRPLIPVFFLRECTGRNNAEHRYHQKFSHQLNHFQPFLLMPICAWEGERVAPTGRLQERCHVVLCEESINTPINSHGFELSRTVWYSSKAHKSAQITKKFTAFGL